MTHRLMAALAACFVLASVLAAADPKPSSKPASTKAAAPAPPAEAKKSDPSATDLAAIRASSQAFAAAFNKGDAKAIAALWTETGDYRDELGRNFAGRAAIEKGYAEHFAANPKVQIRIIVDSVKLLSDGAAIEDGRAIVDPPPAGVPAISQYTAVHVKAGGKWLMSTVRDTHVELPSGYRHVADLEWLIGTWRAEANGVKQESVCRWIANKSFVERKYTTTQPDGMSVSGVQIIGINAESGQIQSWNFSSDGGHAIGIWSAQPQGWAAQVRGVTGDGVPTTAVNVLTKLDENAYTWQSIQRTVGGRSVVDTDEVVLRRSK